MATNFISGVTLEKYVKIINNFYLIKIKKGNN